jgi:membrane protein YfhO
MGYGLQDFRSYDGVGVTAYSELLDAGFRFGGGMHHLVSAAAIPLLDLLNVKYVMTPADVELPPDRFVRRYDGQTRVYENMKVRPRAFLVDRSTPLRGAAALRAIRDGALDFSREAIVDEPLDTSMQPEAARGAPGTAVIRRYTDTGVSIETQADGRRLLVLTDIHYPGWTARVDGVATPIHRTNYAFRGVTVPPGRHIVEFRYEPRSFRIGALMSVTAIAVVGLLLWWPSRRGVGRVFKRAGL